MNNINSLIIEGNMVRDPVMKETPKGYKLCTFSIATNRSVKTQNGDVSKEVSFFDIETWGTLAESCVKQGAKGKPVRIVGRLRQNRWEGADGKRYSRISVVAEHVEFKPSHSSSAKHEDIENEFTETESAADEDDIEEAVF